MKRIVMVIPNLSGGGAARVATILVNQWVEMGIDTHLVSFEPLGSPSVYPLSEHVKRHQIGHFASPPNPFGMLNTNIARASEVRKVLRVVRPDGVVSFLQEANVAAVIGSRGLRLPILISERNHPERNHTSGFKRLVRSWLYPQASRLVVQTQDIAHWFKAHLNLSCTVIPNPVGALDPSLTPSPLGSGRSGEGRFLLSLGRLEPQKGFDLLITAFARIAHDFPEWSLVIHGEGAERGALEAQIAELGLDDRVDLPGVTKEPIGKLLAADLYVHPARFEGYPNALLEALASGCCVVATDCPGATREVLADGRYGLLVATEDVEALAACLQDAMGNAALRGRFASVAQEAVRALGPAAIARRWLNELEDRGDITAVRRSATDVDGTL